MNSNGFYDTGEAFVDLGEPYRDDDESHAFNAPEYFLDFNSNGSRDATDGVFSGVTCTGTAPGSTCDLTTTSIGSQLLIIMSTDGAALSNPVVTGTGASLAGSTINLKAGSPGSFSFVIKDLNGNAMAHETTIVTDSTAPGAVTGLTNVIVPCDSSRNGTAAAVTISAPTAGDGIVTVSVTSKPLGLVSTFLFNLHVVP